MVPLFSGSVFSDYFYYLIPFIFTFALVFGILTISQVFKNQKNVNALISFAIAIFSILSPEYTTLLYEWLPYLCIVFILIFVVVILKNLFIGEKKEVKQDWPMLVTIAILFLVFLSVSSSLPLPSGSFISSKDIEVIIGVAFVALILIVGSKVNFPEQDQ